MKRKSKQNFGYNQEPYTAIGVKGGHGKAYERTQETPELRMQRREYALMASTLLLSLYCPERVIRRQSEQMELAGRSKREIGLFQELYIGEANDHLHNQPGPVIVAEELRPPRIRSHGVICEHCSTDREYALHFGAFVVTAAENPRDIELTLDRYNGSESSPMAKIAEQPTGEIHTQKFMAADMHTLFYHAEADEATIVTSKVFAFAPFLSEKPLMLEQSRFDESKTLPPEIL